MNVYRKLKTVSAKREKIDKIELLFKSILSIFQQEDRSKIISIFLLFFKVGALLEYIVLASIFFLGTYYTKFNGYLLAFIHFFFLIFLIFLNISKEELTKLQVEINFLSSITKNYRNMFINKIILYFIKEKIIKYNVICVMFSVLSYYFFVDNFFLVSSLLIFLVFFYNLYIFLFIKKYITFSSKEKNIMDKIKISNNERNIYSEIIKRLVVDSQLKKYILLVVLLEMFVIVISYTLVLVYFNLSLDYLNIVFFSFFPTFINAILIKFSTELLLNPKIVIPNYYLFKKYNEKNIY